MGKVEGSPELQRTLQRLSNKNEGKVSVVVFYTQNYALIVHEDMDAKHPNGGNAKYLQNPFVELHPRIVKNIRTALKKGLPMSKALFIQGLLVQRASQKQVPVELGFLKGSADTKI